MSAAASGSASKASTSIKRWDSCSSRLRMEDFIRDTRKTYSGLAKGRAPGMRTPARVAGIAAAALTARIAAREQARHPGEQLLALVAFAAVQCRQRAVQVLLRSEEHTSEL